MNNLLSITASIGEMDTAYVVIALVVIAVLWVVIKLINNNKE